MFSLCRFPVCLVRCIPPLFRNLSYVTKDVEVKYLRNIGIIAHIDAGKTTTTERMLYYSGFTDSMGEVHEGDTIMDYMPQERERGITITSAAITFKWKKHKINLIDTPGHVDFTIEVERALCALDGCVVILDSSAGVEVQTLTVWGQANRHDIPSIIYLNKMDKFNSDFEMSLNSISQKLKIKTLVLQLPVGRSKSFSGVIDIVKRRKLLWSGINDGKSFKEVELSEEEKLLVAEKRNELIETIVDSDDICADKFILDGLESLTDADLLSAIKRITLKKAAVPVLCGSSYKNIGVQLLMDAILLYLPNPLERTQKNVSIIDDNLCALVFKIIHHKKYGPLTFIRLYSGEVIKGQRLHYITHKKSEKIENLMVPLADDFVEVEKVSTGNIAVVSGLKDSVTGDTLTSVSTTASDVNNRVLLQVPDPVFFCTIESPSPSQQNQLELVLKCLAREDPTFQVEHDNDLGQIIISGMGELHIDVIKERILREYGINAYLGPLQVSYRETVTTEKSYTHVVDKNLGGVKNYIKITLNVVPYVGAGKFKEVKVIITKENELGKIRTDHLKFINNGISQALNHGPILGFPVIDVKVKLLWLEINNRTTGPMITAAASQCLHHALQGLSSCLLEPVMTMCVTSAPGNVGRILSDLSQRRSDILSVQSLMDLDIIQARTPLAELRGYSPVLRAITSGSCTFSMEFNCYRKMDSIEQAKATEEVTGFIPI